MSLAHLRPVAAPTLARAALVVLATTAAVWTQAALPAAAATGGNVDSQNAHVPPRTVQVTGQATVEVRPDHVRVVLGVDREEPNAADAQKRTAGALQRVLDALDRLKVPRDNIQTTTISLQPIWRWDEKSRQQHLVGYRASQTLRVSVDDLALAGPAVDAVVKAGANRIDGIEFTVRNQEPIKRQALARAVADGADQAQVLAQAAGVQLGELLTITSARFAVPPPIVRPLGTARMAAGEAGDTSVQPGLLEYKASVTLVYAIR